MKSDHLLLPGIVFLLILSSCSGNVYKNIWQEKQVRADGLPREWQIPLRYFDNQSKLQYTVTNDSLNLYVCIFATDEQSQAKIINSGLQLWIDSTGMRKQLTGILFPLSGREHRHQGMSDSLHTSKGQPHRPDARSIKDRFNKEPEKMQLVGFSHAVNGLSLLQNESGISAGIGWDSIGRMTYEAVIPFRTFYKKSLSVSDSSKIISVVIIVPGVDESTMSGGKGKAGHRGEEDQSGGEQPEGMNGGGFGGGMGGGGRRGGDHGGGGNFRNGEDNSSTSFFEKDKISLRVKLATVPGKPAR